jgi:hypothetical protein
MERTFFFLFSFISYFYSSKRRAILKNQNDIYMLESYSYILVKSVKNLFNIFLYKKNILIGVVLISYNQ